MALNLSAWQPLLVEYSGRSRHYNILLLFLFFIIFFFFKKKKIEEQLKFSTFFIKFKTQGANNLVVLETVNGW